MSLLRADPLHLSLRVLGVIIGEPPVTQQLMECFGRRGVSVIAVQEVSERETSSYGIVAGEAINDRLKRAAGYVG